MKKPEKMIIYNLFPNIAGSFVNWQKHLMRASQMGFNWVFVNPVQKTGSSGSLYAIADYFSINPRFVDCNSTSSPEAQLQSVIDFGRDQNLDFMVDLVINHCSVDSDLLQTHPEWFLWESPGRISHPFCCENGKRIVWEDLAKFDHYQSRNRDGLLGFFFQVIEHLIGLGFKGFRCDAAYQIPSEFWSKLIGETKALYPDVFFLAETLGCRPEETRETARSGFDYVFNSSKWWDFYSPWLMQQYDLIRPVAPSIAFPESHDTARLCEELGGNLAGIKQRYLFAALFSAGVMIPIGFEYGFRKRLHVVSTIPQDWEETVFDLTTFIATVNQIKSSYRVFQEESATQILPCGNPQILYMWKAATDIEEECLIILNKNIHHPQPFYSDNLYQYLQTRLPLKDISPEYRLDYLPTPFSYNLRPGQGIVLMASSNSD